VTPLSRRLQAALDEGRILVLGTQVLLGFQLRAFFEPRFSALPEWTRSLGLLATCALLVAFTLICFPASYHRIVAGGEDRPDILRVTTQVLAVALLPLGIGLGFSVAVPLVRVLGAGGALTFGAATGAAAFAAWYGFTYARRSRRAGPAQEVPMEKTELSQKVRHVLTEARMVIPGAQALLGFQLVVILTPAFDELPRGSQLVHVAAIAAVAAAVVLLMTPAAYHRIVEEGEETERFHRVATRLVVAGMAAVGLGMCTDLFVVARKVLRSDGGAAALAATALAVMFGVWFGVTGLLRARSHAARLVRQPSRS
jgi:hypothetical protein